MHEIEAKKQKSENRQNTYFVIHDVLLLLQTFIVNLSIKNGFNLQKNCRFLQHDI